MKEKMGKSSVSMFNRDGDYLGVWGTSDERGFALGAHTIHYWDGIFWTTDRDGHTVKKFDKDGNLLLTLGMPRVSSRLPSLSNFLTVCPSRSVVQKIPSQ